MKIKKILLCLICMLFIGSVSAINGENDRVYFDYPASVKAGEEFEVTMIIKNASDLKYVKATNFRADGVTDTDTSATALSGFVGTGANNSPFKAFNSNSTIVTGLEITNATGKAGNTVQVLKFKFKAKSNLTSNDQIHIRMDEVFIGSNVDGTNTENISNSDGYCVTIRVTGATSTPKCEYKDGKYYDKNGNIVTKSEYEADCDTTPKCKIENGKYYDNKGNVVTKEAYEEACGNPNTGINTTLVVVVAGTLFVIGCYAFFKKSKMYY